MLNHTNMIPEKWDKLYLYSSVIDKPNGEKKGELYFYYIPKGLLKKKPVNVYEIPNKFNLDESDYLKLVSILYGKIKLLREEFRKSETGTLWSNITISIENFKFKVEYNYEDLENSDFNSYERHIVWRYKYLGIGEEQINKKDKEILRRYILGPQIITRKETYETGIYIRDVENKIAYNTDETENTTIDSDLKKKEIETKNKNKAKKNQLLISEEQIRKYEEQHKRKNNNSI